MNKASLVLIKNSTEQIRHFLKLNEETREKLKPILHSSIQTTLDIYEYLTTEQVTYKQISEDLNLNENTVKGIIRILINAHFPIDVEVTPLFGNRGGGKRSVALLSKRN